jgi:acetoin utilization deacetylase AcuC-like enzyme
MIVLYDEGHDRHHPRNVMRLGQFGLSRDVPERAAAIRAAVRESGHIEAPAARHGMAPIAAVHAPDYLDFLRVAYGEWRLIPGVAEDVLPHTFPVRDMTTYPHAIVGRAGYHMQDLVAPIGRWTYEAALASANLSADAAFRVLQGERAVYALGRPPGHHAYRDMGGGACYLNNAAIATEVLRREFRHLAIVDIEVHHGNGTQNLFYDRQDVLFVSLHRDPVDYWPYLIGHPSERGRCAGEGFNFNLPLAAGTDDAAYLAALGLAERRIAAFAPEALVVSLGVDAHRDDPSQGLMLSDDGFARIGERLAAFGLPTVLIQEGGYNLDRVGASVAAVLDGFASNHR